MARKRETVSYSELDTYRQCPLKHHLSYVQRWKKEQTSDALARGTGWHAMLEAHYGAIREYQTSLGSEPRALTLAEGEQVRPLAVKAAHVTLRDSGLPDDEKDLLLWMYEGHLEQWGVDRLWWIEAVEIKDSFVLPRPGGGNSRFLLKVKIDLVVRDLSLPGSPVRIVDHKSARNMPNRKELDLDDQFGLYELALRVAGWKIHGTVYNVARTQRNKGPMALSDRFDRVPMTRSDPELLAIGADAYLAAEQSRTARNLSHPFASPNTDQCKWKCDFLDQHIAARKIGVPVQDILSRGGYVQDFARH